MLGLAAGRPAIVPDLPAFAQLPDDALVRYPPGVDGLRGALVEVAGMPADRLLGKASAARAAGTLESWDEIAERTEAAFEGALDRRDRRPQAGGDAVIDD
jgi:hypothetical protein